MKKIAELRTLLGHTVKAKEEGDMSLWATVMQPIDKLAVGYLSSVKEQLGDMSTSYVSRLSDYRQKVTRMLQDSWGLTENEDFEQNEILAHLDRVIARVALHLTPTEGKAQAPLPLLGGFLMDFAWESFVRIEEGIAEVRLLLNKTYRTDDSPMDTNAGITLVRDAPRLLPDVASEDPHDGRLFHRDVGQHRQRLPVPERGRLVCKEGEF